MEISAFDRGFLTGAARYARIGSGAVGGKAAGLLSAAAAVDERCSSGPLPVAVPRFAVIATDAFDRFVADPKLAEAFDGTLPDDRIAHAFCRAELPARLVGDLRSIADSVRTPLAVRSSSVLEDAIYRPFAGVYNTVMLPNNQPDPDERYRRLVDAVKLVWASTYFADARAYRAALPKDPGPEKMAVVIQEVVGRRAGDRFYPDRKSVV